MQITYLLMLKKSVGLFSNYSIISIFDSLKSNFIDIKHIEPLDLIYKVLKKVISLPQKKYMHLAPS